MKISSGMSAMLLILPGKYFNRNLNIANFVLSRVSVCCSISSRQISELSRSRNRKAEINNYSCWLPRSITIKNDQYCDFGPISGLAHSYRTIAQTGFSFECWVRPKFPVEEVAEKQKFSTDLDYKKLTMSLSQRYRKSNFCLLVQERFLVETGVPSGLSRDADVKQILNCNILQLPLLAVVDGSITLTLHDLIPQDTAGGTTFSGGPVPSDVWTHVAFSLGRHGVQVYLNGSKTIDTQSNVSEVQIQSFLAGKRLLLGPANLPHVSESPFLSRSPSGLGSTRHEKGNRPGSTSLKSPNAKRASLVYKGPISDVDVCEARLWLRVLTEATLQANMNRAIPPSEAVTLPSLRLSWLPLRATGPALGGESRATVGALMFDVWGTRPVLDRPWAAAKRGGGDSLDSRWPCALPAPVVNTILGRVRTTIDVVPLVDGSNNADWWELQPETVSNEKAENIKESESENKSSAMLSETEKVSNAAGPSTSRGRAPCFDLISDINEEKEKNEIDVTQTSVQGSQLSIRADVMSTQAQV